MAHAFVPGGEVSAELRGVESARVGAWSATRDRALGTITQVWGSHVDAPGAMTDATVAERAARAFLAAHVLPAGTRIADFVVSANRVDRGKRTVAFVQTWNGMRVIGGQMHVVFANDRLFYAASDAFPHVAAFGRGQVVLRIGDEYRVANVVEDARTTTYVEPNGNVLAQRSRAHHATSTLMLDVGARYASGARVARPAPLLELSVDGSDTTTDAAGGFGWVDGAPGSVTTTIRGPLVRVINEAGPAATTTATAQPGVPLTWGAPTDELVDAQLSAFVYASEAKAVGRRIDPSLPWLDQTLDVHVNVSNTCNALSTGDEIYFYRANAQCENTARVADIVHHEFGHSFHAHEIIPGAGGSDASITEGIADFFAANVSDDSGVGRGFDYTDDASRELDPIGSERIYPRDLTSIAHYTGLILGGTLWDLRAQLIATLGKAPGIAATERIFLGILHGASDVTKAYNAALVADDDDGDLANGTPNGCAIERAFGRHGLVLDYREMNLAHARDGSHVTVIVEPADTGCPAARVTAMTLAWRVGAGELSEIAMTPSGATWASDLPAQHDGTVLAYQIRATLDSGETLLRPDNPADPLYQVFVGTPTEIWCERFNDDPMWMQTGALEWDVAASKPENAAAADPEYGIESRQWLGTDLKGNGRYRANITTSIATPLVDATSYDGVHLQLRRWLVTETLDPATIEIAGTPIWASSTTIDHLDREWRFVDLDITEHAQTPFSVAFTLTSDAFRELGGWNLDEICIVGLAKRKICGDGILDPGEACDGEPGCDKPCEHETGGCCSASGDPWSSLLLAQFVMIFVFRRASRRRPSRSVSERMPK